MFGNLGGMASLALRFGEVQKNLKKMKEEMAAATLAGKDPTEKVVVEVSGLLHVRAVHIDPALMSSGNSQAVEAACAAAIEDAVRQVKELGKQKFSEATGGVSLSGLI
ncbi:MAG: YbaB/EbfC family nucleoid-associated protein [Lentisphaeria bacterium]|nr:YbaB/EbfC family nucleoid-associated protein [Lentisphaeria bacterium]